VTDKTADIGPRESVRDSVRKVLLKGIFWRILIIEGILLVWSLGYRIVTDSGTQPIDLFWYAVRIIILIGIIVVFIMITFQRFLTRKIIHPLEKITEANRSFRQEDPADETVALPPDTPSEILDIVATRKEMLETILSVSDDRLRLISFIRETFGRYLSRKVVDEILESPEGSKIGGKRETVTILMSDIRGFTSLSETTDPELMVRLLNRYLDRMSRIIVRYEGIIDEFIGDAILAVFGVPEARPDDPQRAVACALAMQNALNELNREMTREGYPPLEMGIGINTGTVIVGNIGSEVRLKYGIVGTAVNTAARIESNTVGGQILIGETTHEQVRGSVTAEPPQTVMMKGMKRPLVVYSVTAIGAPFKLRLDPESSNQPRARLHIPVNCWKVEEKKVDTEVLRGETILITDSLITASLDRVLEPHTDVKLAFEFCAEAHCFEDIYAKVLSVGEDRGNGAVHELKITAITPADRKILGEWVAKAAGDSA
jgi:adenylate cyclase